MTTIAANLVCMASDSKVTHGETSFKGQKIYRIHQAIVGGAGTAGAITAWLRWYKAGAKAKNKPVISPGDGGLDIIVLTNGGLFTSDEDCEFERVFEPHYAVGTGQIAALCLMDYGLSPDAALESICKRTNDTSGPVQVMSLTD